MARRHRYGKSKGAGRRTTIVSPLHMATKRGENLRATRPRKR